ncbi:hypothetical protein D3C80_126970 [compost metagenome]
MIRLLVNVPPRKAGEEVERAELGEGFAQQLLDAGQAEEVEAVFQDTPLDLVRVQCFELEDQMDAAAGRLVRIATLAAELDEADRIEVSRLLGTALRARSEMDIAEVRSLLALWLADPANHAAAAIVNTSDGASEASAADQGAATGAEASSTGPVDAPQPSDQAAGAEGASGGSDVGAPSTHTPPTEAGPSGDAVVDGAVALTTAADPAEPAPAKPAAKSEGGAAKAKKLGG